MKLLTKIFDRILSIFTIVSGICVSLMMIGITVEVFTRYFLNNPLRGVIEVTQTMILWVVFLSAAWLLKEDGHVRVDLLVVRLKPKTQNILNIIICLVSACACLIIFWYGVKVVLADFQQRVREIGIVTIPTAWVQIAIPIGALPLFIQFLRRAYGYWRVSQAEVAKQSEE